MKIKNGFTLIELILVIVLIGVISVVSSARLWNNKTYTDRANLDQLQFGLKLAQKLSMSQRRDVFIIQVGSEISLCYQNVNPCPIGQNLMVGSNIYKILLKDSSTIIPTNLKFNSLGNTNSGKITIPVGNRNIYIEEESGFVHE